MPVGAADLGLARRGTRRLRVLDVRPGRERPEHLAAAAVEDEDAAATGAGGQQVEAVVVLTASQQSRDIAASKRLGAQTYIVKPVDFQNFSRVTPELSLEWALLESAPHER